MQSNGAASVAVVGCGRLGLTMALAFAQKGVNVCGVDISSNLVSAMNDRTFRSDEPSVADALRSIPVGDRRLQATTDLAAALASVETVLIAVDTPSTGGNRHYDHGKVGSVLAAINAYMRDRKAAADGTLPSGPRQVVVCCTVMPGYLVDIGSQLLRDSGDLVEGLLYNPLFIAQGEIMRGLLNPDIILIGEPAGRSAAGDALVALWQTVCGSASTAAGTQLPFHRMSWTSAEITKLSLNCFVTMKIAFANMIGDVCDAAAARYTPVAGGARAETDPERVDDVEELLQLSPALTQTCDKRAVLAAIGRDKRVGGMCLKPGYGFGGPCFPRDNRAFATVARDLGVEPLLPTATDASNTAHAHCQAAQVAAAGQPHYTFRDVAYKPGCPVPLIEESQKLRVASLLSQKLRVESQSPSSSGEPSVTIADRPAVVHAVRLAYGKRFKYTELPEPNEATEGD